MVSNENRDLIYIDKSGRLSGVYVDEIPQILKLLADDSTLDVFASERNDLRDFFKDIEKDCKNEYAMKGKADSSHPLKMAAFPRLKIMKNNVSYDDTNTLNKTSETEMYETVELGVHAHYTTIDWRGKLRKKQVVKKVKYTYSPAQVMRIMLEDGSFDRLQTPLSCENGIWNRIEKLFGSDISNTKIITLLETDPLPQIGMKWVGIDRFGKDKLGWRKA